MQTCSSCGHAALHPLFTTTCRRCGHSLDFAPPNPLASVGEDDDDFGMPGVSLDLPGIPAAGSDVETPADTDTSSAREIELEAGDAIGIGIGSLDEDPMSLDLPRPGEDLGLGGVSDDMLDGSFNDDLDLPTPLEDLDLPTPIDDLNLPTPIDDSRQDLGPQGSAASASAPDTVDALELDLDVLSDPSAHSMTAGRADANLVDAHEHQPAPPRPLAPPGENNIAMPTSPFTSPAPSRTAPTSMKIGLLVVVIGAAGAGAYFTGMLDDYLPGVGDDVTATVKDSDPKPSTREAPVVAPPKDASAERDPAVLERLALDTPQGYQQAQALSEQKEDRVGEAESVLLRALRYGPDPVLAAKGLSMIEQLGTDPRPEIHRVAGLGLLVESKPTEALALFNGEDRRSRLYRAWALHMLDKSAEAFSVIREIAKDAPETDLATALTLAEIQYDAGDPAGLDQLLKLHQANPSHLGICEALLRAEINAGALRNAAELAEALPAIETTSEAHQAILVGLRANLAMRKGEVAVAARLYDEAIKRSDNRDLAVMQLKFSNASGRYRAARQNANRILAENPADIEVLFQGALADIRAGEGEDALKKAAKLSELGAPLKSGEIQARVLGIRDDRAGLEQLLSELREKDLSFVQPTIAYAEQQVTRRAFESALRIVDTHIDALEQINDEMPLKQRSLGRLFLTKASTYRAMSEWSKSLKFAEMALKKYPDDNDALLALGLAQISGGQKKQGEKTLLKLFERTSGYPGLTAPLGHILLKRNRLKELEDIIGSQLLHPEDSSEELVITGARLRLQQGRLEDSRVLIDVVLAMNPTSWEAHMVKGQILIQSGDFPGSLLELELANPKQPSAEL
ncbi:MAG: tetratricopeptide repeat protein, partial [Nannocystaceae bacterium]